MEEILHQLRERWFIPIIYKDFLYIPGGCLDFFHQQYVSLLEHFPHDLHVVFLAIPLGSMDPSNTHPWKCKWTIFLERVFSGKTTLPETNIATKTDGFQFSTGLFLGAMLVSGRVATIV